MKAGRDAGPTMAPTSNAPTAGHTPAASHEPTDPTTPASSDAPTAGQFPAAGREPANGTKPASTYGPTAVPTPADGEGRTPLLSLQNAAKSFGAVRAIVDASIDLYGGEVHGLVGENGAGKSTLV